MSAPWRIALAGAGGLLAACALLAPPPAWQEPPPAARDAPVILEGRLHRAQLANGLRVLVLEDRRLPRVVLGLTARRGEGAVPLEQAGLAPFTAELMKRGAGARDALALARAVDEIGGSLDVASGWDAVSVELSGLSRDFDRLFEILADVSLRPRFAPSEAQRARSEQLAALEKAKDDPATLAAWTTARALYPRHRYGRPLQGAPESVARLDAAAARTFHATVFVPRNAVLSASGNVEAQALLERAREAFGGWQGALPPAAGAAPPERSPPERQIWIVDRPDLVQARIVIAHEGIARADPDRIATSLMNSILGGSGFSSRLTERVRAQAGLTYAIHSGFSMRRQPGPFRVSTFTRVAEAREVVNLVLAELERGRAEPPSGRELRDVKTLVTGSFALGLETSDAVMASLVDLDVYDLPEDSLDTYRARVRGTSVDDAARAARQRLHPERAAIVLVGPAHQLVPQFEDLAPIERVEP